MFFSHINISVPSPLCKIYKRNLRWAFNKKENHRNKEYHSFPTCLLQFRVSGSRTLYLQLSMPHGGTQSSTGHLPLAAHTHAHAHTHIHSDWDNVDIPAHLRNTYLWDVEVHQSPRRKPTQAWGEHENSKKSIFFSLRIIRKQHWTKQHYSRARCISSQLNVTKFCSHLLCNRN